MSQIKVTPDELLELSNDFIEASSNIQKDIFIVQELLAKLGNSWQGGTQDSLSSKAKSQIEQLEALTDTLNQISLSLEKTSIHYRAAEDCMISNIANMFKT